jgi:RimJ/RimL family protein N-acetyltransferase
VLRPWGEEIIPQMASWGKRGFPYHPFDLGKLRRPDTAKAELERVRRASPHRHYVACEDGAAVGRVSVNLRDEAGLYIWAVHVPPELEGRGICRRMLAALMSALEHELPSRRFVLNTNSFAEHAHRAYLALGFEIQGTRWHFDLDLAKLLWQVEPADRRPIARHIRFHNGRWEVRTHLMVRPPGAEMDVGSSRVSRA